MIILITASLSSKTYHIALEPQSVTLDGTWSIVGRSRLVCMVGICFRILGCVFTHKFPRDSLWSLVSLVWFAEEWNTSITKSQRSRAEIPSIREPSSREIIPDSVALCETEVCFLHIELIGTNVWHPNVHKISPEVDFESSRSPAKSESWNSPQSALFGSVHHMATLFVVACVMNIRNQTSQGPFGDCSRKFVYWPQNVWSTNACQIQAFQDNLSAYFCQFSNRS